MRHWEFWRKEERESSSGVRLVSGRRKLHSFWIWKKESGVDEGRNPSGGERFYVSRGTDWRGSSEPRVLFMRAEWSLFFFDNSGSGRQKSPYIERLLIFGTWTIQPVLLVSSICPWTCFRFVISFHQAHTITGSLARFYFAQLRRTSHICMSSLVFVYSWKVSTSSESHISINFALLEIPETNTIYSISLSFRRGRIS
jgi:hypothetical protein